MAKDKKTKPISGDTARKIWLAGIGAYGRAFSEAQEQLAKVSKGSGKLFEELVQKGEVLETVVTHKSKEAYEKVSEGFDIDERITKMRARLKRTDTGDMSDIEDRLDAIEAKLDAVLGLLSPQKSPRNKPTPKKRAPAKKTTAKKATAKKTTPKKKPTPKRVKK